MRINLKLFLLTAISLILVACSYEYRLEVVNYSSEPITIFYKFKENSNFQIPKVVSFENWRQEGAEKDMTEESFQKDLQKREVTLKLEPNQVVYLDSGVLSPEKVGGMMNLSEIIIEGNHGKLSYSGDNFYKNFEVKNSSFIRLNIDRRYSR